MICPLMLKQTRKTDKGLEEWEHQPCLEEACSLFYGKKNKCSLYHNSESTSEMRKILDRVDFVSSFQVIQSGVEGVHADLSNGLTGQEKELEKGRRLLQDSVSGVSDVLSRTLKEQQGELESRYSRLHEQILEMSVDLSDAMKLHQEALARGEQRVQERIGAVGEDISGVVRQELAVPLDQVREALGSLARDSKEQMETLSRRVGTLEEKVFEELGSLKGESEKAVSALLDRLDGLEARSEDGLRHLTEVREKIASDQTTLVTRVEGFMEETQSLLRELIQGNSTISGYYEQHQQFTAEAALREAKASAREYNNQGVVFYHKGAHEAAARAFEKAIELDTDYAEVYNNLGLVYTELNRPEHAQKAFEDALVLRPELVEAYHNLGMLYYTELDYLKAKEMFAQALEAGCRDKSMAYTNFGNSLYQLQQYEEAAEAWNKALKINPLNQNAKKGLALLKHQEQGIL